MSPAEASATRAARLVAGICMVTIVFDGYDLLMYGAVTPSLLAYVPWSLTPEQVGAIGSYALLGMLLGGV